MGVGVGVGVGVRMETEVEVCSRNWSVNWNGSERWSWIGI